MAIYNGAEDGPQKAAKEWHIMAKILDRLFVIIYICIIVVSLSFLYQ